MPKYHKLVRDKIPEILDSKNIAYEKRIANDAEYKEELIKKLQEEVDEFKNDLSTDELVDVFEVVLALSKLPEYKNLEEIRLEKLDSKGGFENRIILKGEK